MGRSVRERAGEGIVRGMRIGNEAKNFDWMWKWRMEGLVFMEGKKRERKRKWNVKKDDLNGGDEIITLD